MKSKLRHPRQFCLSATILSAVLMTGCSGSDSNVKVQAPFEVPASPELTNVESCSVYEMESCEAGRLNRCNVYDTNSASFVTPDATFERVLDYERRYDLYHSPMGISAERVFTQSMAPGTPEAEWSSIDNFAGYRGGGDSAIWSGTALNASILRYMNTGTEADYQRVEQKVRDLLTLFDVTQIPGYLARYHFLQIPPSAPQDDTHYLEYPRTLNHTYHQITDPAAIEGLPDVYANGYVDTDGTNWGGMPMWNGSPSIDQYSGMTTSLPAVYGLLRDETLKSRIATHMTCYINRLRRIDIINIQNNNTFKDILLSVLSGAGELLLDPDDVDLTTLNNLAIYYTPQPNELNAATFDRSCPDTVTTAPQRVLDAEDPNFLLDMLELAADLGGKADLRENGIDHYYVANGRGQDAVHLLNLASAVYLMTGDNQYRDFIEDTLVTELDAVGTAKTFLALRTPKICRKYYEIHIAVPPLWSLINLLGDSTLRTQMQEVFYFDSWQKDLVNLDNAKFSLMTAGVVPESIAPDRDAIGASAWATVQSFGGYQDINDPRRMYNVDFTTIADAASGTTNFICPTQEEVDSCANGIQILGTSIDARDYIFEECTGAAEQCVYTNGCTRPVAETSLPIDLRVWADNTWQRSPFEAPRDWGSNDGRVQSPGTDLSEAFWLARQYGYSSEGEGQVLAWEDVGTCP